MVRPNEGLRSRVDLFGNFPDEEFSPCSSFTRFRRRLTSPSVRDRLVGPAWDDAFDETRLLLAINEGVSVELTDRAQSLIEKRDDSSLTVEESSELLQLADEVERRGVERLALSKLPELRGVSLRELMQSLGVAAADHG